MWVKIQLQFKKFQHYIINSIAFYPILIGLLFLMISILSLTFEFSERGTQLKMNWQFLSLKDASTARTIISAVTAGIISITVFSFSMVMIVLNQTASQMSNRILDNLIGSRFQQITLGIYVGTLVYSFFILSTIRDNDSGLHVPALSTYLLILITIFDIFLFIYFLHYITQSVKYNVIIRRIFQETLGSMKQFCILENETRASLLFQSDFTIDFPRTGVFAGFNERVLLELCQKNDCVVHVLHPTGTFVMKGFPIMQINKKLPVKILRQMTDTVFVMESDAIGSNYLYGFQQLTEVAIKALSPGINDPGTAIESLRSLFQLLNVRLNHFPKIELHSEDEQKRILLSVVSFEKMFSDSIFPIWDYGKNDRLIQQELLQLLTQMQSLTTKSIVQTLMEEVKSKITTNALPSSYETIS
jgi:uncharacterized membrane protein